MIFANERYDIQMTSETFRKLLQEWSDEKSRGATFDLEKVLWILDIEKV